MLIPARHFPSVQRKTYHIAPLLHNDVITKQTPSAINVSRTLLRLISVAVFNVTHPPVLSALLLTLSASRFLVPDFILHHHDRMTSMMPNLDLFLTRRWSMKNARHLTLFHADKENVKKVRERPMGRTRRSLGCLDTVVTAAKQFGSVYQKK